MYRSYLKVLSVVVVLFTFIIHKTHAINHISDVTELTEDSKRKTPLHSEFYDGAQHANLLLEKEKADIETVKQNIDAYQKLVKVDIQKLSGHQKDMVEKIVDRVARLKTVLNANATSNLQSPKKMENISHLDKIIFQLSPDYIATTTLSSLQEVANMTSLKGDQTENRAHSSSSTDKNRDNTSKFHQATAPKLSPMNFTTKQSSGLQNHKAVVVSSSIASKTSSANNHSLVAIPLMQYKESNDTVNVHENFMNEKQEELLDATTDSFQSEQADIADHAREDYYTKGPVDELTKKKKPSATTKPTKYHYYPHNQHIYLLPECAIQQVCNAVYVRLNYTQPLCACPSRYRDPCSASLNEDDQHTTKLIGNSKKKAITLAKTCETTTEMRECRSPKDWSLLALQNTRTGKSHYLVICRCPDDFLLEGPMAHDQPTYASVPGIRVFGMMCVSPRFSIRKPSIPPPRRQQPQKPLFISPSDHYSSNKNPRPTYEGNSYQIHHSSNYLNRPESSSNINYATPQDFVDNMQFSGFNGIYGRNNEKRNENEVDSTTRAAKHKRSARETIDPEFPWDKVEAFKNTIIWN